MRRRLALVALAGCAALPAVAAVSATPSPPGQRAGSGSAPAGGTAGRPAAVAARRHPKVRWRRSRALGLPWDGRLVRGVRLPPEGRHYFTWDPVAHRAPNRWWRRYGTDLLIRKLLRIARAHRRAHPEAPRVAVGDLSRPRGGDFGERFGGLGHGSHQNGLDVDVYYPRRDRRERQAFRVRQIDRRLAQDLVDRFVRAGAVYVFVGPRTDLRGARRVVQGLVHHDDHMHVRIRPRRRAH